MRCICGQEVDTPHRECLQMADCPLCGGTNCTDRRDLPYGAVCRNPDHDCPECHP